LIQNQLVQTKNVIRAIKTINYLINRPIDELVGLGLIYGKPGLGKTRFVKRWANENGWLYIRLDATDTVTTFAKRLYRYLTWLLDGKEDIPRGNTRKIYGMITDLLKRNPHIVIIIDEIDYSFGRMKLLGMIRDIVDETYNVVIMVGMQDAYHSLLKANNHYFDRCNGFCEFQKLDYQDIKNVSDNVSEITFTPEVIKILQRRTDGNLRRLASDIDALEKIAKVKAITQMDISDLPHGMLQ
jgi:DNA transposition AAA+ family ATPase